MSIPLFSRLFFIFIAQILPFLFVSCRCLEDQKTLLLQLKDDLVFNPSLSTKLLHWNETNDYCDWPGVACDTSRHVVSLRLDFESIEGRLENLTTLFEFQYLEKLNLMYNSLSGSIPKSLFKFQYLEELNLMYNSLSGSIPESLFSIPSLRIIRLAHNKFSGQLNEISNMNSSNLESLGLHSNRLEGPIIPEYFFIFKKLKVVSLSYNFFNGTIKLEKLFQNLPNLQNLSLSYNNLSVELSSSSSNTFPQFRMLNLASCNMYEFPYLRNQNHLENLDLSDNKIAGEVPNWIWEINGLKELNLSHNSMTDLQKPYYIYSNLIMLDLHSNSLQGTLPMLRTNEATYVDFSSNNFQGSIPLDIGKFLPNIEFFSVANNSLTGTIPISLCNANANARYFYVLDLSRNFFNGSIPPCLFQTIFEVLNLGRNNFTGDISDSFPVYFYCRLQTLDLSHNNIEGRIPKSLASCRWLEVLNLGNNKLSDGFPCVLGDLSGLKVLVLRSNKLHGDIKCSEADESWPMLQIIDIAFNSFSGSLPPRFLSSWRAMKFNNYAQLGQIGTSVPGGYYQNTVTITMKGSEMQLLKILTIYTSIDFSSNNFQGEIPDIIGELISLYVLNLSHNSFTGTIPESIGNLKQLGSLDLSTNTLTGLIPKTLSSLTFLSVMNLSYNNLFGMIPKGPQFQTFSPEIYEGNVGLCGFPLNMTSCDSVKTTRNFKPDHSSKKGFEFDWRFSAGLGFATGIIITAALAFSRRWNEQLDRILKWIYPNTKSVNKSDDHNQIWPWKLLYAYVARILQIM